MSAKRSTLPWRATWLATSTSKYRRPVRIEIEHAHATHGRTGELVSGAFLRVYLHQIDVVNHEVVSNLVARRTLCVIVGEIPCRP